MFLLYFIIEIQIFQFINNPDHPKMCTLKYPEYMWIIQKDFV